jgi:hypothetical protein
MEFNKGNVTATFSKSGCWVEMFGDNGETQSMALEPNEMLLLYMALGDYFEHEDKYAPMIANEKEYRPKI